MKTLVIGAGKSGVAAANFLAARGDEVLLTDCERESRACRIRCTTNASRARSVSRTRRCSTASARSSSAPACRARFRCCSRPASADSGDRRDRAGVSRHAAGKHGRRHHRIERQVDDHRAHRRDPASRRTAADRGRQHRRAADRRARSRTAAHLRARAVVVPARDRSTPSAPTSRCC